jgi:cytochrome c oxidase subunit 3/cytochrome o ubiquinol oxidase subunit 3
LLLFVLCFLFFVLMQEQRMSEHATTAHAAHGAGHAVGHGTSMGVDSRKMGVWAFIGSETLFFAALIVTYFIYKPINVLRPDAQLPHEKLGIQFTGVLAAILLASSVTMVLALAAARRGDKRLFTIWQLSTIGLGLCFLGGQIYEFYELVTHEGVTLKSSMLGMTFYLLTGFHGTHVAIGVTWLLSVFLKVRAYPDSPENLMDIEMGGLYWHFVDLVWVGVFTLIYLLP